MEVVEVEVSVATVERTTSQRKDTFIDETNKHTLFTN